MTDNFLIIVFLATGFLMAFLVICVSADLISSLIDEIVMLSAD